MLLCNICLSELLQHQSRVSSVLKHTSCSTSCLHLVIPVSPAASMPSGQLSITLRWTYAWTVSYLDTFAFRYCIWLDLCHFCGHLVLHTSFKQCLGLWLRYQCFVSSSVMQWSSLSIVVVTVIYCLKFYHAYSMPTCVLLVYYCITASFALKLSGRFCSCLSWLLCYQPVLTWLR